VLNCKIIKHLGCQLNSLYSFFSDDYHDLWPLREQPATYLKDIKSWKPPVSAGCIPIPPISPPSFSEIDFELVAAAGKFLLLCFLLGVHLFLDKLS